MLSVSSTTLASAAVLLGTFYLVYNYFQKLKSVDYLPGIRIPFSPFSAFGFLLPDGWLNPSGMLTWMYRFTLYEQFGNEIVSLVPLVGGPPLLYTRSVDVAKQMLGNKAGWDKIQLSIDTLSYFGENILASLQNRWPRHRRIVAPGFNQALYVQVWKQSIRTYDDMIHSSGWDSTQSFTLPDSLHMTSKFSLYIIAACGFGLPLAWSGEGGEKLGGYSLEECMRVASESGVLIAFIPKWVLNLPFKSLRRIRDGTHLVAEHLKRAIQKRRAEGPTKEDAENRNVFQLLLNANEAEKDTQATLTDDELISNVFLLMLAGHETTGRGLGATLGMLACNPEEQEKAHQEVMSVLKGDKTKDPAYEDFDSLPYVNACFTEAMRIFPSVILIVRHSLEDTVVTVPSYNRTTELKVAVSKEQFVIVDFVGQSYDPKSYPNPGTYLPSRWLDPSTEPLLTFSYGPRVCIGRKFAYTESICLLALILRDWKVEPILAGGESPRQWRDRVLDGNVKASLGFGPKGFPLKWTRRA